MATIWRQVPYLNASGAAQMATDEFLLNLAIAESEIHSAPQPILRFYGWSKPAISLGYHQRQIPEHWTNLAQQNRLDLVRRPSGGRAVLHQGDLTYAVILKADFGDRRATYEHVCEFLIRGLANLDIKIGYGKAGRGYIHHPSCFNTATSADLVIEDGRKLIGSAQVYRSGFVLQHGAIAIQPNYDLLRQIFGEDVPVVGLGELLPEYGENLEDLLMDSLTRSAAVHFGAKFVETPLEQVSISPTFAVTTL
jgi:lipoate---protein ligase